MKTQQDDHTMYTCFFSDKKATNIPINFFELIDGQSILGNKYIEQPI